MENLIEPGTSKYQEACQAASTILGANVRYLAEYAHGAHAIGAVFRRGDHIEIPIRRRESKYGVTGGYLRSHEHMLPALLREYREEEMPNHTLTINDLFAFGHFVGIIDAVGHQVGSQAGLREWVVILLLDIPESMTIFSPSSETSEKVILSAVEVQEQRHRFRGDGEYPLIFRAALAAAGLLKLPRITSRVGGEGVYLNIVDTSTVKI